MNIQKYNDDEGDGSILDTVANHAAELTPKEKAAFLSDAVANLVSDGTASAPSEEADYLAEMEKLGTLRDQGIITEEEFEAKKKQLLGL